MSPVLSRFSTVRQRALCFGAHFIVGLDELATLFFEHRQQQRPGRAGIALRKRANGGQPRRTVRARQLDRRLRQRQQALDLGIGLLRQGGGDRGQRLLLGTVLQFLRGGEANAAIGRHEPERRNRRGQRAPQPIVDDDVFASFRQRRNRLAGERVARRIAFDDQHAVFADGLHFTVDQRLQQRQRRGIALRNQRADGLGPGVALTERKLADHVGGQRPCARHQSARWRAPLSSARSVHEGPPSASPSIALAQMQLEKNRR
jgi:hypothetical protein